MKKLNLNVKNVKEVLTRAQLKQVVGGMGTGLCDDECTKDEDCPNPGQDPAYTKCREISAINSCQKEILRICTK